MINTHIRLEAIFSFSSYLTADASVINQDVNFLAVLFNFSAELFD